MSILDNVLGGNNKSSEKALEELMETARLIEQLDSAAHEKWLNQIMRENFLITAKAHATASMVKGELTGYLLYRNGSSPYWMIKAGSQTRFIDTKTIKLVP